MADEEKRRKGAGRPKSKQIVSVKWVKGKLSRLTDSMTLDELLFSNDPHLIMAKYLKTMPMPDLYLLNDHEEVTITEMPFSSLTAQQLANLLPILNDNCFVEALSVYDLQEVLEGKRTAKVKNIGVLAYILKRLAERGLICDDWQLQAERQKMFVSARNTPIKAKKLASYLSRFMEQVGAYDSVYSQDDIPPTYKAKMRLKSEVDDLTTTL